MRTFKPLLICILLVVLMSPLLPAQAQGNGPTPAGLRPDAPQYAKHGPFWVGTREFTIPDKDGKRPLPLTVWYPALNPDGKAENITYTADYSPIMSLSVKGHALLNAPPDAKHGSFPLIIFSHTLYSSRFVYTYYTEHLASYGFVVAAIDHTGNTIADSGQPQYRYNVLRPQDILREIQYADTLAKQDDTLKGLIDTDHIAVTGHSFGGWTALAAAGAQMNLKAYQAWCGQNPQNDPLGVGLCSSFVDHMDELAVLAGLKSVPDNLWPPIADPRVDAVVALDPGTTAAFGKDGLASVRVPVMVFAASGDVITPPQYHAYLGYDYLTTPRKALVTLAGANNPIYCNSCADYPMTITDVNVFATCSDSVWDMNRAHDLIDHFTTAFLLDVLKGDKEAHKALLPDAVKFVGIEYKSTMQ